MNKMSRYWLGWRLGTCTTPSISLSRCSLTANCAFTRLSDNLYTISFGFKRLYQCFTCYTVWWPKTVFIMFSHYRHYFTGYLDIAVASCSFEKVKLSKFCLSPTNTKEREVSRIFDIGHWTFECPMSKSRHSRCEVSRIFDRRCSFLFGETEDRLIGRQF